MTPSNEPIRILILNRHPDFVEKLQTYLAKHPGEHFELAAYPTLAEALQNVSAFKPDAVLMDFYIFMLNPSALIETRKKFELSAPVVLYNGLDDDQIESQVLRMGARDYLIKGEEQNPKNLTRILRHAVEHKHIKADLEYRIEIEKLLNSISAEFIHYSVSEIDQGIESALAKIGTFLDWDRCYLFWYSDPTGRHMAKIREWCREGITAQMDRIRKLNMGMFPYLHRTIRERNMMIASRLDELPEEASGERVEMENQGIRSCCFTPLVLDGRAIGFIGMETISQTKEWHEEHSSLMQNISALFVSALERQHADRALRESEQRYALIAQGIHDGIWDWNVKNNTVYYSSRWKSMIGCEEHEIGDAPEEWFSRIHPDDIEEVNEKIRIHLEGLNDHYQSEHRILHKDGTYLWMLARGIAVRDSKGRVYRMAGSQTDITARKKTEEQIIHNALHDALTGLPSRALFMDRLRHSMEIAKIHPDYQFAVLFLDLDRFKAVNDGFGHWEGDQILLEVAKRLQSSLQPTDTVARFGGDEFTVLIDPIPHGQTALSIAEVLHRKLHEPFTIDGKILFTTASIGVALSDPEITNAEDILRKADTAMYRAKLQRTGHPVVYSDTMHARVLEMLRLETELHEAIQRKHFKLEFQPIIALADGRLTGFEALIRWEHPDRGRINPDIFIPLAEETGLIIPLGLWVLKESCRQMQQWSHMFPGGPLGISVNLSVKQFMQPDLAGQIQKILQKTGLPGSSLSLEITETVFVENTETAVHMLKQLKEMDIRVHLDDFGTGYSSLNYLQRFQVDTLKIDRSFIRKIGGRGENSEIVKTIVDLAHNLDIEVIAEGVETKNQLELLKAIGCEFAQGFLFSKPLSKKEIAVYLGNQNAAA